MNTWTDRANTWGEAWMTWAAASALQSSPLIVVVLGLARVLRGRVNPVWIHGLWMLVLVKLVLPPTVTSPTSLGYWLPRPSLMLLAESHNERLTRVTVGFSSTEGLDDEFTGGALRRQAEDTLVDGGGLTWRGGVSLLGVLGSLGVVLWVARAWGRVRREIWRSTKADAAWTAVAVECAMHLRLRRVPEVRFTGWLHSPAVCGLGRQVILIPEALATRLDPEARRDVLLHEMAHVRRGDLWAGTFEILVLAVYWWHPLVWVARVRLQRIREEIADAVVVLEAQRDAGRYAETLLRVAKAAVGRPMLALGLMGILESGGALRRRVEVLLDDRPRRVPRLGWSGWLALLVLALVFLPMGEGPRSAHASETSAPTNLVTRVWRLNLPAFVDGLEQLSGKPLGDSPEAWNQALEEMLKAAGVTFEPPAAFLLEARKGRLMVRTDQRGVDTVQKVVEVLTVVPPMVQIEARFVSFSHPKLKELFPRGEGQWEVLSAERFRQVWQQISQWVPAKHRSTAPRVTTLVGRQAAVEQYEKLMIRDPGEEADREESFGATLDVTPEQGADDAHLVLRLRVTQKEFLGYDDGEPRRPNISVSEARARPRLRSGETAMLNLVKPTMAPFRLGEEQPIPALEEKASPSTRVTVAFVTATFIDPAGNLLPQAEPK